MLTGRTRHIWMDVPHSANPKPSWYGESVGRYEGNTLVVDTIGFNDKTFVNSYRTPHSDKLHVVERFSLIDGGNTLEVEFHRRRPRRVLSAMVGYAQSPSRGECERRCRRNSTVPRPTMIITISASTPYRPPTSRGFRFRLRRVRFGGVA